MSSVVISGDVSGSVTLQAPSAAGTTVLSLPNASGTVVTSTNIGSYVPSPAGGSTTTSSAVDITLTSSSTKIQNITMTAADKSVILPDATTITTLGANIFILVNNGGFPYAVKVSGGNAICTVPVAGSVMLHLTDNTTAAGKWAGTTNSFTPGYSTANGITIGASYGNSGTFAITQSYPATTITSSQLNSSVFIDRNSANSLNISNPPVGMARNISATSALVVYQVSTTTYAVVVTLSGGTLSVGTPVAVLTATTPTQVSAVVLSSTAAFVFVDRSAAQSLTIPLVLSGASITVGTSTAYSGSNSTFLSSVAMSSTLALVYNYDAAGYLRTFTHNGSSAPTLGTASTSISQTSSGGLCKLTSTTALIAYNDGSDTIASNVVTVSGTSAPTFGTKLTTTAIAGNGNYQLNCYAYSATEAIIKYNATERGGGYTVTISGTTQTLQSYFDGPGVSYASGYINGVLIGSSIDTSVYYGNMAYASCKLGRAKYNGQGTSSAGLSTSSINSLVVSDMTGLTNWAGCTYFDSSNFLVLYSYMLSQSSTNYTLGLKASLITFV